MELVFTAEQTALRASLRRFLEQRSPESEVRRLMDDPAGFDPATWELMAHTLGLTGLAIPESHGGAGASWVELLVVFEELGKSLLCAPFFSTVAMATPLLLALGEARAEATFLPGIASGAIRASVALLEESGRRDEGGVQLAAAHDGGLWRLSGVKQYVVDGVTADLILVVARTDAGISVFAVQDVARLTRIAMPVVDATRKLARIEFDGCPARLLGDDGGGWAAVSAMLDRAALALAAESVGGAQRALDMAVAYAKQRVQFGRPIGSFQAVKHKCAEMLVDVESARSAAYYAAWRAAAADPELPVLAVLAQSVCTENYFRVAAENIQIHGGIGFTWEHPAHLYYRRAMGGSSLLGDPAYSREQLATRIGV